MLAKTTDKNQRKLSELLPLLMPAYRTSVHKSTGYTPYFLLFGQETTIPINLQFPRPVTLHRQFITSRSLQHYEQACQYLKGQQKRQNALYNAKVHGLTYTEGQMVFLHNSLTPQGLSPKLHSFWRELYKITQLISALTYKIPEIETNKELFVPYDRMKPCRLPHGGLVPLTNTPPAPMQPPNEILFESSTAKFHSFFCEAPVTCTPTVGPVPVTSSGPLVQSSEHTTLRRHQLPTTTLPSHLRPRWKKHFQTAHLIPFCPILLTLMKSLTPQIVPSTLLFPPHPFLILNTHGNLYATFTSIWRSQQQYLLAYDNTFSIRPCWA